MKKFNKIIGNLGEDLAAQYLQKQGYEILERNWGSKWGEIDIVCKSNRESNRRGLFGPDLAGRLRQQDHSLATYTHKFTKQDGYVPISQLIPYLTPIFKKYNLLHLLPNQAQQPISPKELHSLIRGLSPWPGVWTKAENRVIKIVSNQNSQNIEALEIVIDGKIYL